ncbi:DUF6086 family protein [Streptomyces albus]|uniref:DUF6086 family protein n=1 Tax=Streptomyces albus TaxID=1888 RepID=UPI0033CD4BA3
MGAIEEDECERDATDFPAFVETLLKQHRSSQHAVLRTLLEGFTGSAVVLLQRAGLERRAVEAASTEWPFWETRATRLSASMTR